MKPLVTLAVAAAFAPALAAQTLESLRAPLRDRIAASGAEVGLFVLDLQHAQSLAINADLRFHAASTMKVAVMIQVFREIDAGRMALTDRITVRDSFRSIADGSTYAMRAADDADSSLYRRVGQAVPVRDLVALMIRVSSNLATNLLIDRVRPESVQATMRSLGADSMQVLRGVEDQAAYRAGLWNTTTARALGRLYEALADGIAASPWSSGQMLEVLWGQRVRDAIPAGLPRRTRVAHKPGWITAVHHDGGVVFVGRRPRYVIVVLTRGLEDRSRSAALIADLTRVVHEGLIGPGAR